MDEKDKESHMLIKISLCNNLYYDFKMYTIPAPCAGKETKS